MTGPAVLHLDAPGNEALAYCLDAYRNPCSLMLGRCPMGQRVALLICTLKAFAQRLPSC